ncbi:MAG: MotA/TolQ/ExbB proton channel family protein [Alphaproteobacteria bacterium]|nr:MotA/TolQ/ExbB proton channel family protein [Alphaproteobacteria bacterium]
MLDFLGNIFNPVAFALVLAGSLLIAMLQVGRENFFRLPVAFRPLFRAHPRADRDAARHAMRQVEHVTHLKGLACADRVETTGRFLRQAVDELANAPSAGHFQRWAAQELASRAERHDAAIKSWLAIADAAPALGMAGTIFGLIRMFSAMDDPATIGPAMAMALLTTLYGVVLANMVAGPIAARLALLSEMEIAWQRELTGHMMDVACQEMTRPRQQDVAPMRQNAVRQAA